MTPSPVTLTLKRGGLYFSCDVYETYFPGLQTIILLRRGDDLVILPVRHAAAGGYVLKPRKIAGDRVAHAPDFFREHGFEDEVERELSAVWSGQSAGLVAADVFGSTSTRRLG